MKNSGQALIWFLITLPALILLSSLGIHVGQAVLFHNRAQNFCNRHVLDALSYQAEGLSLLGQLNPIAKFVIDSRREVDQALASGILEPALIPLFIKVRESLIQKQFQIEASQKTLKTTATRLAAEIMGRPQAGFLKGHIKVRFTPHRPDYPHGSMQALLLHVKRQVRYASEVGAPLELDSDFGDSQTQNGEVELISKTFFSKFKDIKAKKNMRVHCRAKIILKNLEDRKWSVVLTKARPSSS